MITRSNLDGSRTALFSDCLKYRYELIVRWGDEPPLVMCCLNPSTADEMVNDPTVARQCERAARLGFGSFMMLNAFAIRSTDPKGMLRADDPYGEWRRSHELVESYRRIVNPYRHSDRAMFIAAWGAHAKHRERHYELIAAFRHAAIPIHYLVKTNDGYPGHPLYISYDVQPLLWN